jgi:hypothetical protein
MTTFGISIMNEFNQARTNPLEYADKIEKHLDYINFTSNQQKQKVYYYSNDAYPKISLAKGKPAFKESIKILRNLKPTHPLEYRTDLAIPIPSRSEYTDIKEGILECYKVKKLELAKIYKSIGFHYDNGGLNPEISAILQIVDDTNTNAIRRANILNGKYKYIGVSISKVKLNRYYIYITFAGDS